ncbi:hypothetical protein V6N13_011614 [Hibiscus sabdariffa]
MMPPELLGLACMQGMRLHSELSETVQLKIHGLPQTKETRWFPVPSSLESGQVSPACVEYFEEVSGQIWTAKA